MTFATALDTVGFALVFYGLVRAMTHAFHGRYPEKTSCLAYAAGFFLLGIGRWLERQWPSVGIDVFFCALFAVLWWRSGGDDDWRKRRRRLRDWARSHIPRPRIVQIRPLATVPS